MPRYKVDYSINSQKFQYSVEGVLAERETRCLLLEDNNLAKHSQWDSEGYSVAEAWGDQFTELLLSRSKALICEAIQLACNRTVDIALDHYHLHANDAEHLHIVNILKDLPKNAGDILPCDLLDAYISQILNIPVSCYNPKLKVFGCNIRIVRPNRNDNNPLHKDAWLDHLRNAINLYIPIAGSNQHSSLSLIPKSHYWNEADIARTKENCTINGMNFTVPSVISSVHGLELVRPALNNNQILIFSPYLIHGGACNTNDNISRISLEMRFWEKAHF